MKADRKKELEDLSQCAVIELYLKHGVVPLQDTVPRTTVRAIIAELQEAMRELLEVAVAEAEPDPDACTCGGLSHLDSCPKFIMIP